MRSLKEKAILDYISKINFNKDWSIKKIKSDIYTLIGETPGMHVDYKKDVMINETSGRPVEIDSVRCVSIVFTDVDDKLKTIEYLV